MSYWDVLLELVPQVLAAIRKIRAQGGHGSFEFDLDVKDKATGVDIIAGQEIAVVTF